MALIQICIKTLQQGTESAREEEIASMTFMAASSLLPARAVVTAFLRVRVTMIPCRHYQPIRDQYSVFRSLAETLLKLRDDL